MPRINHRMFIRSILCCSRCSGVKAAHLSYSVITYGAQLLCYISVFNVKNSVFNASEQNPLNLKAEKNPLSKIGLFRVSSDPTNVYSYLIKLFDLTKFCLSQSSVNVMAQPAVPISDDTTDLAGLPPFWTKPSLSPPYGWDS